MDIQLPEMNGFEATQKIREYEIKNKLNHTNIVIITTNAMKGGSKKCIKIGMDGYISKLIVVDQFHDIMKNLHLIIKMGINIISYFK